LGNYHKFHAVDRTDVQKGIADRGAELFNPLPGKGGNSDRFSPGQLSRQLNARGVLAQAGHGCGCNTR
jgi:hypothetical protein